MTGKRVGLTAISVAMAVGIAYFLGARLSLSLLTEPDGVAVFWPASGVAAGALAGELRRSTERIRAINSRNSQGFAM